MQIKILGTKITDLWNNVMKIDSYITAEIRLLFFKQTFNCFHEIQYLIPFK
jgi:hypothetical protein